MMTRARSGRARGVVLVLVLLIAAGAAAWYFLLRSTPERTVAEMIVAARSGERVMLLALFAENSQDLVTAFGGAAGGPPIWQQMLLGNEQSAYTIGRATITGDRATVPLTMQAPDAIADLTDLREYTVDYALVREGWRWKVDVPATARDALVKYGSKLLRGGLQYGLIGP